MDNNSGQLSDRLLHLIRVTHLSEMGLKNRELLLDIEMFYRSIHRKAISRGVKLSVINLDPTTSQEGVVELGTNNLI